jgi:hypothetical protein
MNSDPLVNSEWNEFVEKGQTARSSDLVDRSVDFDLVCCF